MASKTTTPFTTTASAAQVSRNFGRYKELAQRGIVAVTSHGRDSVVILSADEYALPRDNQREVRQAKLASSSW